ncbi:MAG: DUF3300 domain-containing protein [Candidatus Eremiobacteraeota bacterium]|nr:DUF3300 domain-containing protein [Candidatus Eremiobacteraeota bacterium]
MNSKSVISKKCVIILFVIVLLFLAAIPGQREAQARLLSIQELQTVVAPVALYPDDMLSNVLVAATVPDEVVQAARYLKGNSGQVTSMPSTDWDPSVKALLYFPDVLYRMNNDLTWTQTLGYALINQQRDVMSAVQAYRNEVYRAGNLKTNSYQRIVYDNDAVEIMPAVANRYYLPQYNPSSVITSGNPLIEYLFGVLVGDWWNSRTTNWGNQNIVEDPASFGYYNYPAGGYYSGLWGNGVYNGVYNGFNTGVSAQVPMSMLNPAYFGYYNNPKGGYYPGIWGNLGFGGMHTWAPTPRANGFYRNGIVNNSVIINNAAIQFHKFQSQKGKFAIPAGSLLGTIQRNNGTVTRLVGTLKPRTNGKGNLHQQINSGMIKQQLNNGGKHPQKSMGGSPKQNNKGGSSHQQINMSGGSPKQNNNGGGSHQQINMSGGSPKQGNNGGGSHQQNNMNGGSPKQNNNGGGSPKQNNNGGNSKHR